MSIADGCSRGTRRCFGGGDEAAGHSALGKLPLGQVSPRAGTRSSGYPGSQGKLSSVACGLRTGGGIRGAGSHDATTVNKLINRVAELEQAMNAVQEDNTALRERLISLQSEADDPRVDTITCGEQVKLVDCGASRMTSTRPVSSIPSGSSSTTASSRAHEALGLASPSKRKTTLLVRTPQESPSRASSRSVSSPQRKSFAFADLAATASSPSQARLQQFSPRSQKLEIRDGRCETTLPWGVGMEFHLEQDQEWTSRRHPRDPRSYASRLTAENNYRFALSSPNVKALEACLQNHVVGTADDTERYLEVQRAYEERTRRDVIRRAISAQEQARCKLESVLDHDRSGLPTSCQWATRGDELKGFQQALSQGEVALKLSEEACLQSHAVDHLRQLMEDVRANLKRNAMDALQKAMKSGNVRSMRKAVQEARMAGVEEYNETFSKVNNVVQAAESFLSPERTNEDDPDNILMAIKERIDRMKMKVTQFFEVYDTDRNGYLGRIELRDALSDMRLSVSDATLATLMDKVDSRGVGYFNVKDFAHALAKTERETKRKSMKATTLCTNARSCDSASPSTGSPRVSCVRGRMLRSNTAYWLGEDAAALRTSVGDNEEAE